MALSHCTLARQAGCLQESMCLPLERLQKTKEGKKSSISSHLQADSKKLQNKVFQTPLSKISVGSLLLALVWLIARWGGGAPKDVLWQTWGTRCPSYAHCFCWSWSTSLPAPTPEPFWYAAHQLPCRLRQAYPITNTHCSFWYTGWVADERHKGSVVPQTSQSMPVRPSSILHGSAPFFLTLRCL